MAQLGARFHGMEEVKGSNPFRSTKLLKDLPPSVPLPHSKQNRIGSKPGPKSYPIDLVAYPTLTW